MPVEVKWGNIISWCIKPNKLVKKYNDYAFICVLKTLVCPLLLELETVNITVQIYKILSHNHTHTNMQIRIHVTCSFV